MRINLKIIELTSHLSNIFKYEHYLFILYEFDLSYKKKLASKFRIVEHLEKIHLNEIEIKWYWAIWLTLRRLKPLAPTHNDQTGDWDMRRVFLSTLMLLSVVATAIGVSPASAQDKLSVRLDFSPWGVQAAMHLAQNKGWFGIWRPVPTAPELQIRKLNCCCPWHLG